MTARSQQLIDELAASGYDIEGDLAELLPRPQDHEGYISPTTLSEADLAPAAIRAATGLLRHSGRQRRRIGRLQAQLSGSPHRSHRLGRGGAAWIRRARRFGRQVKRRVTAG